MSKTRKRIIFIVVSVIILGLISFTIFSNIMSPEDIVEEVATPVVVSNPEKGDISRTLYYSGTLVPKNTTTIISKVSGKIEKIFVKEGDQITKEDALVQIEDESVSLQATQAFSMWKAADAQLAKAKRGVRKEELENTKALLNQAKQDLALAKENFERTARLYDSGTIAKSKYDEAENAIKSAETQVENYQRSLNLMEQGASEEEIRMAEANADAARAQYDLARLQVDFASLQAPAVGIVAKVLADEGNLVGPSTPILAIVQINPIVVNIPIPEKHYGEMLQKYKSIKVRVYPNAYPGSDAFVGSIRNIAPVIDAASRTFNMEVEISNPYQLLRPGMYANVELVMETYHNALLLPKNAVVQRNGKIVAFLAVNGQSLHSKQVEIETGISDEERIMIKTGLSEEDMVVVEGNLFLEDGQEIRVLE